MNTLPVGPITVRLQYKTNTVEQFVVFVKSYYNLTEMEVGV